MTLGIGKPLHSAALSRRPRTTVLVFNAFVQCAPIGSALLKVRRQVRAVRFGLDIVEAIDSRGTDSVLIAHDVVPALAEAIASFVMTERPTAVVLRAQPEWWQQDPDAEVRRLVRSLE